MRGQTGSACHHLFVSAFVALHLSFLSCFRCAFQPAMLDFNMSNSLMQLSNCVVRSDLWFSDGNIVIICGHAAFKVHRGQLERHSEVFRGLFSIPQPDLKDLVDGCPWVELHDAPGDILCLLRALYDGLSVFPLFRKNIKLTVSSRALSTDIFKNRMLETSQ